MTEGRVGQCVAGSSIAQKQVMAGAWGTKGLQCLECLWQAPQHCYLPSKLLRCLRYQQALSSEARRGTPNDMILTGPRQ